MNLDLSNDLDGGNFLLRGDAKFPEDVKERYNTFRTELNNIARNLGTSTIQREDYDKIVALLNKYRFLSVERTVSKAKLSLLYKSFSLSSVAFIAASKSVQSRDFFI